MKKFDLVICDSVLNSVDSLKAEQSVVACLNLFCNNKLFISGRNIKICQSRNNLKKLNSKGKNEVMYFLDENGFSADFRRGSFFYQKFHSKEMVFELLERNGFKINKYSQTTNSWYADCIKIKELSQKEYIDAINFEFDLPLPQGRSFKRNKELIKILNL